MRYFGKICEKHFELNGERRKSNGTCIKCAYEATNKYRNANKVKVRLQVKMWKDSHKEQQKDAWNKWYSSNPGKMHFHLAKRRTAKKRAIPKWFESDKVDLVYEKANELGFDVDHIVPLQHPLVCGLHCWANLQLLDESLNSSKGNRYWPDMPEINV